ncbi:hypothetical protein J2T60_000078 [Natronospira proteinivora]|uniref:DUF721 domain-containing protein n=1 Tax=Natronospira proteinivora TaxID=1807133 RepID=A0ABT1G714_9GAMM|nr:DciA family protein [Natronospira proteinivora]MCP1726113.1 hypothetical protein [Natronospira proteinivora]
MRQAQGPLAQLIDIAGRQNSLTMRVRDRLPGPLAPHCLGVEFHEGKLRITMDSPAWATRLRYLLPQLESSLKQLPMPAAQSLEVRAGRTGDKAPAARPTSSTEDQGPGLSADSREHIRQAARGIRDPELRQAFERLAGLKASRS